MADFLAGLCHTDPLDPLPVWENGTFGLCFNQLVLNALPHTLLAVSSAWYLSAPRWNRRLGCASCGWSCRAAASFLLALLFLVDVAVLPFLGDPSLYLVVLADGVSALAWIVHGVALVILQRSVYGMTRGPSTLLVLALLPVVTLIITLVSYCQDSSYLDPTQPLRLLRLVLLSAQLFLLLMYLVAFAFPRCVADLSLSINDSDSAPLLPGSSFLGQDGQIIAEDGSSWVSQLFYLWLNPLMKRGQRQELNRPSDVYLLPRKLRTRVIRDHFDRCLETCRQERAESEAALLNKRLHVAGRNIQNGSWSRPDQLEDERVEHGTDVEEPAVQLLWVLHKAFGLRYYLLGLLKLAGSMLGFTGPLLLNELVGFMESGSAPISRGVWCALWLFASTFVGAVLRNWFTFEVLKVSLSVRAAVISAIYRKALQVSSTTLARFSLGEVVNFMSTDTDRLINFFPSFHELWSLPVQFAITLYLLYLQVGVAFLGGLALALLLVPLNKVIASRIMENNKHMLRHKDARVKLMTEILFGMRVIKFYTWEKHFHEKISACRREELARLKTMKYLDAVCVYTWAALPVVISILTFITYVLLGHELTAAKVFTALALVGMLILPLNNFPWVVNGTLEAKVSLDRIQRFLQLSDQDLDSYYSIVAPEDPQTTIEMKKVTFSWAAQGASDPPETFAGDCRAKGSLQLCSLNLRIRKGALVAVVGKVGCGKSSLLAAITGELNRCEGVVYVQGRDQGFGLAMQEPWIQHATVQENILFGKDYNARFYQAVIEACALTDDLNILPSGDQTEVGENGVTLSGGQKARLALARAVYMILDANYWNLLEPHVKSLLKLSLQEKDIYLLDDPLAAVDADVANHLLEKCILGILKHKTTVLCTHRIEFLEKADVVILMDDGKIVKTGTPAEILPLVEAVPKERKNNENKKEKDSVQSEQELEQPPEQAPVVDSLIEEEQKQMGAVALRVYSRSRRAPWRCGSTRHTGWRYPVTLSETDTLTHNSTSDLKFYLTVYGSIAAANSIFTAVRAFLFAYGAICAATAIHNRLLDRVLKATVTFFDTTPLGRIMNRFSSDVYSVDDTLPFILNILLSNLFGLLGMLVVMSYGLPWILLVLVPLGVLYYYIQHYYRHTSRELKRLYSLTLSPIYTQFSETLTGLSTIRASRAAPRFELENENRLESNQRCLFASNSAMQWLDMRLQMIGVAVVTSIAVIAVIQHQMKSVNPGLVGLALSYALSVTTLLSGLIFSFTQTETQLVSVERTEEYSTDIPIEPQEGLIQKSRGSEQYMRSKLAIIPQDPFLFSGTVRENLDPWGRHSEAVLLDVLEQCHLREVVMRMGGLGVEVGEKGKSLSVGQRQLVCLARALLTQAKVLCIDEATASVDQKTDKILQQTIREKFRDKTVLTIAHRLNTIMDSDKVLVMHAGKVVEFDTPKVLCQREDSFFYKLVHSRVE
ncbi:UNVERIFIED_CONTAM: hypothetical protein FKN15_063493 [Acipenser sinensis]